jgi:hypothetical protein
MVTPSSTEPSSEIVGVVVGMFLEIGQLFANARFEEEDLTLP